ncbi:MAG: hypothetical protein OSJ58_12520 [Dysosmobacter sp.]|nr:hypothetical protein [Dysosmobacter sp.]
MLNCCDYDVITLYHSGELNSRYKTDLTGKLECVERIPYGPQVTASFKGGVYQSFRTMAPIVLYRVFGQYRGSGPTQKGARLNGGFASTEFAESIIDAKLRLALDPAWANTKMYEARLIVPAGISISIGTVASVVLKTGTVLPGGADQILLPQGWPESWITGYRRLTARQLQLPPCFSPQRPPEYDSKENLYRMICPVCGCEECQKLPEENSSPLQAAKGSHMRCSMFA